MIEKTEKRAALFMSNARTIEKEFSLHSGLTKRLAALLYAQEDTPIDCADIKKCYDMIKGGTRVFSALRGNMSLCVAALLALSGDPEHLLGEIVKVYDLLRSVKLRSSDYLAVAAYQIAAGSEPDSYSAVIERARAFYDGMKAYNRFYTGQNDYVFAAMLGLSDIDVDTGVERIEQFYTLLKGEFRDKNSVQALSQILVLSGTTDETTSRILALRDILKERKLRFDRSFSLSSLGVLALLPVDVDTIVSDIEEAQALLRAEKGFRPPSVDKQELLLLAAAIVAWEYAESIESGVLTATLSTSIANIIIAQNAAMVAAISASSAAYAAASSN